MARDIKTTPIVYGKDALRFHQELEVNRNRMADKSVLERIEESVKYIRSFKSK
jgi:hypothetical protein